MKSKKSKSVVMGTLVATTAAVLISCAPEPAPTYKRPLVFDDKKETQTQTQLPVGTPYHNNVVLWPGYIYSGHTPYPASGFSGYSPYSGSSMRYGSSTWNSHMASKAIAPSAATSGYRAVNPAPISPVTRGGFGTASRAGGVSAAG